MSSLLWKYYLTEDVENFRRILSTAGYSNGPHGWIQQRNSSATGPALGSSPTLSTTPKSNSKGRKSSGAGPATSLGKGQNTLILTRADLNSRDNVGLTILHHASSSTSESAIAFATALLEHPLVDLYLQDYENGWTPLHRALYFGNITIARAIMNRDTNDILGYSGGQISQNAGALVKVKDLEGNSPFEVFGSTVAGRSLENRIMGTKEILDEDGDAQGDDESEDGHEAPRQMLKPSVDIEGDEVFTFGSNKNLTLGFGDEDDRQYPERIVLKRPDHLLHRFYREFQQQKLKVSKKNMVKEGLHIIDEAPGRTTETLPYLIRSRPIIIQDVALAKLSTAVLTSDPESNLYMCGYGKGGRLGTGDERTRFNFTCIEGGGLAGKKINQVALGENHTIAISDEGELFSWGQNAYGQLGYKAKDEETVNLVPRQIFGTLKREIICGAAASRIHSVVHSSTSLWTFGKNEGQLGLIDSDARSLDIQVIPRRVAVTLFQSPILMVSAIDRATVCLLENHDVWIFANYGYAKLAFPLEGFPSSSLKLSMHSTRYDSTPNHICKIASGGETVCALSRMGEAFAVNVGQSDDAESVATSTTNPTKIRNALSQPQCIWSLRKGHMAARDIDVGQDGSVIICTDSGSVWRRVKRAKVYANGGSETKQKDFKFTRIPALTRISAVRSNAFGAYAAVRKDVDVMKSQVIIEEPGLWDDIAPLLSFNGFSTAEGSDDEESETARLWSPAVIGSKPNQKRSYLTSSNLEEDLKGVFIRNELAQEIEYDVEVVIPDSSVAIPAHRFMIAGRSRVMRMAFSNFDNTGSASIPGIFTLEEGDGRIRLIFHGVSFLTILNFVNFVYEDSVIDFWHYTRLNPQLAQSYRQTRIELMKIAAQLGMEPLEASVRVMVTPARTLDVSMKTALSDPTFFEDGDAICELSDGEITVHSILMCQRCPFFEGLFHGRAKGAWLESRREDSDEPIRVDLKHIPSDIFKLVVQYIYTDGAEDLFDDIVTPDLEEFLDLVLDVMSCANELMLDRLSQACQKKLASFVNTRNVCSLLNVVAPCAVTEFKDAALEYLCLNLEAMLENRLLDELEDELLFDLDEIVRDNQLAFCPMVRSKGAELSLFERHPELAEAISRDRQTKIDSFAFQNKVQDDYGSSYRSKIGSLDSLSSSPTQERNRRRSSKGKLTPASPALRPRTSIPDLMFDFDEDGNEELNDGLRISNIQEESPSRGARQTSHGSLPKPDTWYDAKGKALSTVIPAVASPSLKPEGTASPASPFMKATSGQPWGSLSSSKLDMKDILKDDPSSGRKSNISLALSQSPSDAKYTPIFNPKLTQKERKKREQQLLQKELQRKPPSSPDVVSPTSKSSPWQNAPSATKVSSLKELLTTERKVPEKSPVLQVQPRKTPSPLSQATTRPRSQNHRTSSAPISASSPLAKPQSPPLKPSDFPSLSAHKGAEPSLQLSMDDIITQQRTEQELIKAAAAKRSLLEIQEEQAFQEWWDLESARLKGQGEGSTALKDKDGKDGKGEKTGRSARGGRSGRGRGRGRGGGVVIGIDEKGARKGKHKSPAPLGAQASTSAPTSKRS
jgi:inhibitor of Bruton tyrosine kinase